jgi:hypothetical protein
MILGNISKFCADYTAAIKISNVNEFKHKSFQSLIFTWQGNTERGKIKMATQNKAVRIKNAFSLLVKRRDSDEVNVMRCGRR